MTIVTARMHPMSQEHPRVQTDDSIALIQVIRVQSYQVPVSMMEFVTAVMHLTSTLVVQIVSTIVSSWAQLIE